MSSSVHFKFKSQKEPSRVTFDGTGISVFELKREIISQSRLGDGTDFELSIYNEHTGEEYDDDTAIIPRSTSVIARRLPAARPGKGGASRYVSGKMPVSARGATSGEPLMANRAVSNTSHTVSSGVFELNNAQTEEEKINALFSLQATQWKEQQQEMANATPVPFGRGRGKPVNIPDHPPPPGYLCYRCREKGHWIQACPTNNDPKYDGKYRVKRSTGIPRSLQTKVEKPDSLLLDGPTEEMKNTGVMVNADGDFVIAKPDKAAWELYQEKAKASAAAAAEAAAAENSKELQARGLECPIDKRMFLEPTKTPCCQRTYCVDCISNALIESDFVCPGCASDGVLLDNLIPDEKMAAEIKAFETEKADSKREKEKNAAGQESRTGGENGELAKPESETTGQLSLDSSSGTAVERSRKRLLEGENTGTESEDFASVAKKYKPEDSTPAMESTDLQSRAGPPTGLSAQQIPFGPGFMPMQGIPGMPFPDPGLMSEGIGFMNPMGVPGNGLMDNSIDHVWNPMNFMNFNSLQSGMYGNHAGGPISSGYGAPNMYNMLPMGPMPPQSIPHTSGFEQRSAIGHFSNQQRTTFSTPYAREEDTAYFRQPVNPQRHQAKHRRIRPSDYREL